MTTPISRSGASDPLTRGELAGVIESVVETFYNDGTNTALVALERLIERLRPHEHDFDFFSRTIEACGDMHYYCGCGEREPCDQ